MHEMLPAFQGSPRGTEEEEAPGWVSPGFKSHASQSASGSEAFSQPVLSVLGAAGVVSPSGPDDTVSSPLQVRASTGLGHSSTTAGRWTAGWLGG